MKGDIITYDYYGSLYINMTNRCDCHCVFCIRDQDASALGGLWLQEEPTKEAVLEEILAHDLTPYAEIVFCGYGEPTCRADDLFWICDQLHAAGRADLPPIRLNTNGHGSLINHRDITPELAGRLDAVSVSLNGSDKEEYLRLTRPGAGERGWPCWTSSGRRGSMCPKSWSPSWTMTNPPRRSRPAGSWPRTWGPSSGCGPLRGEMGEALCNTANFWRNKREISCLFAFLTRPCLVPYNEEQ